MMATVVVVAVTTVPTVNVLTTRPVCVSVDVKKKTVWVVVVEVRSVDDLVRVEERVTLSKAMLVKTKLVVAVNVSIDVLVVVVLATDSSVCRTVAMVVENSKFTQVDVDVTSTVSVKQQAHSSQGHASGQKPRQALRHSEPASTGGTAPPRHLGQAVSQHLIGGGGPQQLGASADDVVDVDDDDDDDVDVVDGGAVDDARKASASRPFCTPSVGSDVKTKTARSRCGVSA